jgi:hypothetical protein
MQTKSNLACCLEVSETLLDTLARMGYIEKIDLGCKNACGNCYMKAGGDNHKPLMWAITKKGIDFMEMTM